MINLEIWLILSAVVVAAMTSQERDSQDYLLQELQFKPMKNTYANDYIKWSEKWVGRNPKYNGNKLDKEDFVLCLKAMPFGRKITRSQLRKLFKVANVDLDCNLLSLREFALMKFNGFYKRLLPFLKPTRRLVPARRRKDAPAPRELEEFEIVIEEFNALDMLDGKKDGALSRYNLLVAWYRVFHMTEINEMFWQAQTDEDENDDCSLDVWEYFALTREHHYFGFWHPERLHDERHAIEFDHDGSPFYY